MSDCMQRFHPLAQSRVCDQIASCVHNAAKPGTTSARRIMRVASAWVIALSLVCAPLASAQSASPTPPATPQANTTAPAQKLSTDLSVPPTTANAAATKDAPKDVAPPETRKVVALILPTASKTLGKAADALRSGFVLANEISGKEKFAFRFYGVEDETSQLAGAYRKAVTEDVVAIVGGLTRDGATTISREAGFVPTLALNTTADASRADANNYFQISLAVEWDARLVARAAAQEGYRNVAIISDGSALSKRIQESFEKEWSRVGGTVATQIVFSGNLADAPRVRSAFSKDQATKADCVFVSLSPAHARMTRPYVPQGMPVFATAHTFDPRSSPVENVDLDGVRYLEMPWFAEPDHAAVMAYPRSADPLPADYERLYALGIDAWRVVYQLLTTENSPINAASTRAVRNFPSIDGVTGRITLDGNQFARALSIVEIRDGRRILVKSAD